MDKFLNLLGICRRAGRLSCGHEAAINAVVTNRARLCIVCAGASQRLENEMRHACSYEGKNIKLIKTDYTVECITQAVGTKAAVFTVDDEGFAQRLVTLYDTIE